MKDEAGPHWPRVREGVYSRLEGVLRAKLGPNDLFFRLGETAYLITMPTTEAEDVNAICTRVAFDLYTSFLGYCDLASLQINAVTGVEDDTLSMKRLPLEQIVVLAEKVGIPKEAIAHAMAAMPARPPPKNAPLTSAIGHRHKNKHHNYFTPHAVPPPHADFHFMPIWSVPHAAVTTYACEPKAIFVEGRPESVPMSQLSTEERIQVELAALHAGAEQLAKSWETGVRFLLAVPLSFDVLGTPWGRMEVLSACRGLLARHRAYLSFVLYDVPPGVAQTRLATMVTSLRPFGRSVIATISPTTRAYSAYQGIGLRGIAFNLREFSLHKPFGQNDAEQLAQFARRASMTSLLWDVRDREVLKFAQDAGIQNLSGPAVASPCDEPSGMLRLGWGQVLAQPAVELWL